MQFIDEAVVNVTGGKGGDGCLSFLRARNIAKGGPDGGNGGNGGDVIFVASDQLNTLVDFRYTNWYRAEKGSNGGSSNCYGSNGKDLIVLVPTGTRVLIKDTEELIGDLTSNDAQLVIATGGSGGFGNKHFKSNKNKAPRQVIPGTKGAERNLILQLLLLADIGLVGQPNAGKSTLLSRLSAARPKIADYPFTTLIPNLGVISVSPGQSFVMVDIPGLIKGAAQGAGLGLRFLRHVARTRMLLQLVEVMPEDGSNPVDNCLVISNELQEYSPVLAKRERWLVLTKSDKWPLEEQMERARQIIAELNWQAPWFLISAVNGHGLSELTNAIMWRLNELLVARKDAGKSKQEELIEKAIIHDLAGV